MNRVYLISYSFSGVSGSGFGRFFNYRNDGREPSVVDIESMESKIASQNGFKAVSVISVSRLADYEVQK